MQITGSRLADSVVAHREFNTHTLVALREIPRNRLQGHVLEIRTNEIAYGEQFATELDESLLLGHVHTLARS